jgi:hypothetical protein
MIQTNKLVHGLIISFIIFNINKGCWGFSIYKLRGIIMKRFNLLASLILIMASQLAMANIVKTSSLPLGDMGPSVVKVFGNSFNAEVNFADAYTFTIDAPANLSGATQEINTQLFLFPRLIKLTSVSIYDANDDLLDTDTTPDDFSFNNLIAGNYTFLVSGFTNAGIGSPSYSGYLSTEPAIPGVPVPAAGYLFLSAFLGFLRLRKRSNS